MSGDASTPRQLGEIDTPALLIESVRLERNLSIMAEAAHAHGLQLRPHAKTHKSASIAERQRSAGAVGTTVAKPTEAAALASRGIDDILVCYPIFEPGKAQRLAELATQVRVTVAVDHEDQVAALSQAALSAGAPLDVLVDVDTGLDRTGVAIGPDLDRLTVQVDDADGLHLRGICTHEGFVYGLRDPIERSRVAQHRLGEFADAGRRLGVEVISAGATPAALDVMDVPGLTELRPGNYVFYDAMQVGLGVVELDRCALTVLTTVVEQRSRSRGIVDAGSKVMSSDVGVHDMQVVEGYGVVVGRPDVGMHALSEEHGWLALDPAGDGVRRGERLRIVPNHACATVANFDHAYLVDGETVLERIEVDARGAFG